VWGVAVRASSEVAVARLRAWKGSDDERPFSVLISGLARLEALAPELGGDARALASKWWPGPLTLIVRSSLALAPCVSNAAGATGFRCSSHPVAGELARLAERRGLGPLTATSLNRAGATPATTREAARRLASGPGAPALLDGEAGGEAPATIVDATDNVLRVVRAGAIPSNVLGIEASSSRGPE
jgi:L-threonylcarbamoyladenylate synthase